MMKHKNMGYLDAKPLQAIPLGSACEGSSVQCGFYRLENQVSAMLYEPAKPVEKAKIAILVMHSDADYFTFSAGKEMAERGYRVLCANVSDKRNCLDRKIQDAGYAVGFLRSFPGVEKVILLGHSGGGTLLSAYQSLAENGVDIFQGPEKIVKCSDALAGLPPADGMLLLDSNYGNGAMALFSLDPAVISYNSGMALNPKLDLFNPDNGFKPEGCSYSAEFMERFFAAQRSRHIRLVNAALERLEAINLHVGHYTDDEPFVVPGMEQGFKNNKLYAQDIRLMSHTCNPWPLLKADGSCKIQVVYSLRQPTNNTSYTSSYHQGALVTTVRTFLDTFALHTDHTYGYNEDSVRGIDWDSSYNCPPGNVQGVAVPMLLMGMTAGWEFLAAETIFGKAGSADKTLVFVEGADHLFRTANNCETIPGEFGDTMKTTYDFVDHWLCQKGRFIL